VLRRRVVVAVLVLVSLVLLTIYFRESSGGGLHSLQSAGSTVLRPFEVAANRVAQPFRDAAGWVGGLSSARSENKKLKHEVAQLKQQVIAAQGAQQENKQLKALLHYEGRPSFPQDFDPVATSVIVRPTGQFDQRVVSLLDLKTGASGILRHNDAGSSIILDSVPKQEQVNPGDALVTAGWRSGNLSSIFPRGIPVGIVSSVSQTDIDPYKQIEVTPLVDFGGLQNMFVLIRKTQPK